MRITDVELIDLELSVTDPENLAGVSNDPPPDSEPSVELQYDMSHRGVKVRCVYCKFPNHFHGVVINYGNGERRLVGRDCAESKHGVIYGQALKDFDTAVERQAYLRRKRNAARVGGELFDEFTHFAASRGVRLYDWCLETWWSSFPDLSPVIRAHAKTGQELATKFEVRDFEAEKVSKRTLGEKFEEAKAEAKSYGEKWQISRTEHRTRGRLMEPGFFSHTSSVALTLERMRDALMQEIRLLSSDAPTTKMIKDAIKRLSELKSELVQLTMHMELLSTALSLASLNQIASYAADQAEEFEAESARRSGLPLKKRPPQYRMTEGRLHNLRMPDRQPLGMPEGYSVSSRRLFELFDQALAL